MNCYSGIHILEEVEFENFNQKVTTLNASQNYH
jgi:hypothetical protein